MKKCIVVSDSFKGTLSSLEICSIARRLIPEYFPGCSVVAIPAADGGGLDVWLGSLPGRQITGILCTVDCVKRDVEIKLLLGCTPAEMEEIRQFQTSGSMAAILVVRPPEGAA